MKRTASILLFALCGCATAHLTTPVFKETGTALPSPPANRGSIVVVVEPFFEESGWKITTKTETANVYNPYYGGGFSSGLYGGGPMQATISRDVVDKPAVSRVTALASEQQVVIREILRQRPDWQVVSTAALQTLTGPVDLVRVIIGETVLAESDRTLKDFWCVLGLGIPGLFTSVHETQQVEGRLIRYQTDGDSLHTKLLRYASQPDFAVDTRGLVPINQPFALNIAYEEGVFGNENAKDQLVVQTFAQQLAVAIIAFVEDVKAP